MKFNNVPHIPKVAHTLDGETRIHYGGVGLIDFKTLCGSCWDDGTFTEAPKRAKVTCNGCLAVVAFVMTGDEHAC